MDSLSLGTTLRIGQYYMWLCRKYGVTPDNEVVAALGLSTITDKSDIW